MQLGLDAVRSGSSCPSSGSGSRSRSRCRSRSQRFLCLSPWLICKRIAPEIAAGNERSDEPHGTSHVVRAAALRLRCCGGRVGKVEERLCQIGREAFSEALADDESLCSQTGRVSPCERCLWTCHRCLTHAAIPGTPRLGAGDGLEEAAELVVQESDVATSEDFGDKVASWPQNMERNIKSLCPRGASVSIRAGYFSRRNGRIDRSAD